MKIIGFYNKYNNDFYGYVCYNKYAILKELNGVNLFTEDSQWVKKDGQRILYNIFLLKSQGKYEHDCVDELFGYSDIKDIDVKVLDYKQELRKLKLNKLKLKHDERKN